MKRRLLVVSSVHPADDPRIRYKYIRTLTADFEITYATKSPAPVELDGIEWRRLGGGRVMRWLNSLWIMMTLDTDVVAVHDPELLPAAIVVALVRRIPVVFDLHESLPAQITTKHSIPGFARPFVASLAHMWLSLAERTIAVTLAEVGYQSLFRSARPVFPNYPMGDSLPVIDRQKRVGVLYVGDVSEQRGAITLLEAAAEAGAGPVVYVGRCESVLRRTLLARAAELHVEIDLRGWLPYGEAMELAGAARIGVSPLHDIPNYRFSLPTKTLEYLAMGTPVVASDLPGTTDVIGGLPGVRLVHAGSVGSLAEALRTDNRELALAAESGIADIRAEYRWPDGEVRSFYASLGD